MAAVAGSTLLSSQGIKPRELGGDGAQLSQGFGQVVDMVDDHGCDSTGSDPCDESLVDAAADDTLLIFPEGTYRFDETNTLLGVNNFGIMGRGETTFVAPAGHNGSWFTIDRGRNLLFQNIDLDVTARNTAPTLQLGVTEGLLVRDVEIIGRGTWTEQGSDGGGSNPAVGNGFLPIVRSPKGHGTVERFVARQGGKIGRYNAGRGRVGIFVGKSHKGNLRLVDCHLSEFPNNGIYASRTTGTVQIDGGIFHNNDISQVRLGSRGSRLSGGLVVVEPEKVPPPNQPGDFLNPRGVRIGGGPLSVGGARIRDSTIEMRRAKGAPAISVAQSGGRFYIQNSEIRIRLGRGAGIIAKAPTGGSHPPPPAPHWGRIDNVSIKGRATAGQAILVIDRPGTVIRNVTISHRRGERNGIRLVRSPGSVMARCAIRASKYPVVLTAASKQVGSDCLVRIDRPRRIETTGPVTGSLVQLARQAPGAVPSYCVKTPPGKSITEGTELVFAVTDIQDGRLLGTIIGERGT